MPDAADVARWLIAPQRPADRVAPEPRAPLQLADRDAADEVQPAQLRPSLHPNHVLPPGARSMIEPQAPDQIGRSPPAPDPGPFSTGTAGSVFSRNRQTVSAPGRATPRAAHASVARHAMLSVSDSDGVRR